MTNDPRDLISDSYREMNRQLHEQKPEFGSNQKYGSTKEQDAVAASPYTSASSSRASRINSAT